MLETVGSPLKPANTHTHPKAPHFTGKTPEKRKFEANEDIFARQSSEDIAFFNSLPPILDLKTIEWVQKPKAPTSPDLPIFRLKNLETPPLFLSPDITFPSPKKQKLDNPGVIAPKARSPRTQNPEPLILSQTPQNMLPSMMGEPEWKALLSRVLNGNGETAISGFLDQLKKKGIDGRGTRVVVLEQPRAHSKWVASVIQDPVWGSGPGATVVEKPVRLSIWKKPDSLPALEKEITTTLKKDMLTIAAHLKEIADSSEQRTIVNMSFGDSAVANANYLFQTINSRDLDGFYRFPKLRQDVLGDLNQPSSLQSRLSLIAGHIQRIYNSPDYQAGMAIYEKAVRNAARKGLFIVIAAGNDHQETPFPTQHRMDGPAELLDFVRNHHVISVAATNVNGSPDDINRHTLASFSSRGDEHEYNPTVAAPGESIYINPLLERLDHQSEMNGTSFSAPYVCGLLARMLQIKPDLTPAEGKRVLERTAANPNNFSKAEVGAGLANPREAIRRTMQAANYPQAKIIAYLG